MTEIDQAQHAAVKIVEVLHCEDHLHVQLKQFNVCV
jgi:hypothetical protein